MNKQQYENPTKDELFEGDDIDSEIQLVELDFSDDEPPPTFGELETDPDIGANDVFAQAREAGLTEAALPNHGPTDDDLTPETLIHEDGATSPHEPGGDEPNDQHLTLMYEEGIDNDDGSYDELSNTLNENLVSYDDIVLDDEDEDDLDDDLDAENETDEDDDEDDLDEDYDVDDDK